MTVGELIKLLQQLPEDLLVVVDGYEQGVDEAALVERVPLQLNTKFDKYSGQHSRCSPYMDDEEFIADSEAVYITFNGGR